MNSNVCKHSSDFSLFFKALISKDTDTGTPTEGAARNIFRSPTINTSVASICFHPHSYCNKRCAAPITLSPPASGPLGVHLPSSLLVHTNEVTRAWIALVEWFLCFFTRMEAACSELSATCNWGGGEKKHFVANTEIQFFVSLLNVSTVHMCKTGYLHLRMSHNIETDFSA